MNFWVHYTVNPPHAPGSDPVRLSSGPYTADEALVHKKDIETYVSVTDVCLSDRASPANTARVGEAY